MIRVGLHSYVEEFISLPQTGAVFFILAFGMLLPWRIAMYVRYDKVRKQLAHNQ
ncbi:MAG: CcdC protein domain-containing protein [Tumebacillaceae bacterium]